MASRSPSAVTRVSACVRDVRDDRGKQKPGFCACPTRRGNHAVPEGSPCSCTLDVLSSLGGPFSRPEGGPPFLNTVT